MSYVFLQKIIFGGGGGGGGGGGVQLLSSVCLHHDKINIYVHVFPLIFDMALNDKVSILQDKSHPKFLTTTCSVLLNDQIHVLYIDSVIQLL